MDRIKVLVVDDSALIRQVVTELLSECTDLEVIGTAIDPYDAREKIKELRPDVLTLDVEMPKMDGVTFLRNLMRLHPLPVVMLSTLTTEGADITLEALDVGAVDFVAKPTTDQATGLAHFQDILIDKVRIAASTGAQLQRIKAKRRNEKARAVLEVNTPANSQKIIAIGSSTGGTEAVRDLLVTLPANIPPIVITQHIPVTFSERFANRLDGLCQVEVKQAEDGDRLEVGHVYIAPGDKHLTIVRQNGYRVCRLVDSAPVNRHKPSVDVMYESLLALGEKNVAAILLTGMGQDGAAGMKSLNDGGAHTIAQDQASSLVWGMPGSAVQMGAAKAVLPLDKIGTNVLRWCQD